MPTDEEIAAKIKADCSHGDYAVLHYLTSILDYENEMLISKTDLAMELGMQRPNLSRAFKKLLTHGLVLEGKKFGNMRTYLLNPEIGWRGSGRNHIVALDAFRRAKEKERAE